MSDFKEMLGLDREAVSSRLLARNKASKGIRKVEPRNREIFTLTGGQLPPILVTSPSPPTFKAKRAILSQRDNWEWQPFIHPGRTDGMVFHHWSKKRSPDAMIADYPFAKFAKKVKLFRYTAEEYDAHLQDPAWTKEQTDNLFDLCEKFDLRFVVIADRLEPPRSVEDMKARYYAVSQKLMQLRLTAEEVAKHPLNKYNYDKEYELERKGQYEKILSRGKAEVEEEEYLLTELKRIEQSCKKHSQNRRDIVALSKLALESRSYPEILGQDESPWFDANKKRNIVITRKKEKLAPGPAVKSAKQLLELPISTKAHQKLDSALDELGMGPRTTFTTKVASEYDNLRQDLLILIELQKHVAKREFELQIVRERVSGLEAARNEYASQSAPEAESQEQNAHVADQNMSMESAPTSFEGVEIKHDGSV